MTDTPHRTATTNRIRLWLGLAVVTLIALTIVVFLLLRSLTPTAPKSPTEAWSQRLGGLAPGRLNVVLITIDTLRADRLSCYGSTRVATPHIDRLASEGIRFAHAASTVPFTLPAHSSIMTGTYPPFHGVRENVGYVLDESLPTLAERLRSAGRTTAGFVSALVLDSRWGIARGFEHYFDDFELAQEGKANLGSVQRDGSDTIAEAVRWLDSQLPEPFFLWLHLFDPHDPYRPAEPFRSRYPSHPYDAEVAYTDALVGEFRGELERRGLLERSLLVLTGDHGEGLGQHREGFHGFFVYDSTVHVPLIVRAPGGIEAGRVVDSAVSHVDLLPTVLEAVGEQAPEHVQGQSLLPLMLALEPSPTEERGVYSESLYPLLHYGWAALRSIRTARFKFIDAPRPELYDLVNDPLEQRNILLDQRRTSRELKDRLDVIVEAIAEGAQRAQPSEVDEETLLQLQALGYVAGRGGVDAEEEDARERADPKDRIALHQLVMAAQSDLGAGDLAPAESKLQQALSEDPTIVDAHQMLGALASQQKRHAEAIGHFQRALELHPDHQPALFGLATAYRQQGLSAEALVGFRRLLEIDPSDPKAALAASQLLIDAGESTAARGVLEAAVATSRPAPVLLAQLGELLAQEGRGDEAAAMFERAIAGNDELAQPRFNLAVLYEEQGQLDKAIRLYEETIARAPEHYQAQFNLGRLVGQRGDLDRQQRLWEAAIAANPEFFRGRYLLAKLLMDRGGDLRYAEEIVRQGLSRDTEHRAGPLGYFVLADILNRQGRTAEARRVVEQARRLESKGASSGR